MWRDVEVLVTGGAGAIGSRLVNRLLQKGAQVSVLDDLSSGHWSHVAALPEDRFVQASVTDDSSLIKVFKYKPQVVFHLAALFANQNSVDNPREDLEANGLGTLKLLEFSQMTGVKRFVFSSSSCVYGAKSGTLSEANTDYSLDTPYAISKLLGEKYCLYFHKHYGVPISVLRYFNSYGPGEFPGKYRNVIPNFMMKAIQGEDLIITGTGRETRDFTYCEDVVSGTLLAATKKKAIGQTFNLASGKETTIKTLAKTILEFTDSSSKIVMRPRRSWDHVTKRCGSIKKANTLLGYRPKTKLETGLLETFRWFQNHLPSPE